MKTLPAELKLLRQIKIKLDQLMDDRYTKVEIRSNHLYDFIANDTDLKKEFPTKRHFNQFLRCQHQNGYLKSIIPNYRVDTSNYRFYQWYFRKEVKQKSSTPSRKTEMIESKFNYYKDNKNVILSNGQNVASNQEKYILEKLIECNYLTIFYDHPISKFGEIKYADFVIRNKHTAKTFIWEHFGMTCSEEYKDNMTEKIDWYKNNGYITIENGGNLIYTYYSDEKSFYHDVDEYIKQIIKN